MWSPITIGLSTTVLATASTLGLVGCGRHDTALPTERTAAPKTDNAKLTSPTENVTPMPTATTPDVSRATTAATAASGPIVLADYFPLGDALRWRYDVEVVQGQRDVQRMTAERRIVGTRNVGERQYQRFVTDVTGGAARLPEQSYRIDATGVFAAVDGAPGKEMLILPADPDRTPSWSAEAMPAVALCSGTVMTGETVEYNQRRYEKCVKVVLAMTIIEKSFFGGQSRVPVRMERWFAPRLGMVREVRVVGEEGQAGAMRIESTLTELVGGEGK